MQSKALTVEAYLKELDPARAAVVDAVRAVILKNLGKGLEERMSYGMIGYCVPHTVYPAGYHCDPSQPLPYAGLAAQKNAYSLYLMSIYGSQKQREWFIQAWEKTGKKLDMGKSCIRFKSLDQVPLEVVGEAIRRVSAEQHIAEYEKNIKPPAKKSEAKAGKPGRVKAQPGSTKPAKPMANAKATTASAKAASQEAAKASAKKKSGKRSS